MDDEANDRCLEVMQEVFHSSDVRLKPWPARSLDLLALQSEREVMFVVDPVGNKGKTFLAKFIRANQDAIYINTTGSGDVM